MIENVKYLAEKEPEGHFKIKSDGLYWNDEIVFGFISEDILKENKSRHYLYADSITDSGNLILKYGEALKESVFKRWDATGMKQNRKMIAVWDCNVGDYVTHSHIKLSSKVINSGYKPYTIYGSQEEYEIDGDINGLKNFLQDIENAHKKQNIGESIIECSQTKTFDSVNETIEEINEILNEGYNVIFCELPPRFGKTKMNTEKLRRSKNERIMVVFAYVNTVLKSYSDEVKFDKYITVINVDDYDDKSFGASKAIKSYLDSNINNKVIVYVPLTGDDSEKISLFNKRTNGIIECCEKYGSFIVDEEADFGSKCYNQIKKLNQFYKKIKINKPHILVETGTNIESTYNIFRDEDGYKCYKSIRKNYVIDVLGDKSRKNAVRINYNILYNPTLIENNDGYTTDEMENFSYFFSINENGHLNGESYLRQLVRFIFKPEKFANNLSNVKISRRIIDNPIINNKFASIIFSPDKGIIEYGEKFKKLVEEEVGDEYVVVLINSNITDNKNAEDFARTIVESNWEKNKNNKVILITGSMANRSFSVEEVKNAIFMMDSAGESAATQKSSRTLTPVKKEHNKNIEGCNFANIVDCRLNDGSKGHLKEFVSAISKSSIRKGMDDDKAINIILDKIHFNEYFRKENTYPIQSLSDDEIRKIFKTKEHMRNKAKFILKNNLHLIPKPNPRYTGADEESADGDYLSYAISNIKGSGLKKKQSAKKNGKLQNSNKPSKKETEQFDRQKQHLYFLLNNMNIFNTLKYDDYSDWLYREFEDIKSDESIKKDYSKKWNVDMDTIIGYVDALKNNNYKF